MRITMTALLLLLALSVGAWAQPVQVTPGTLAFNDGNIGFSQSITAIANTPGILMEVAADGGNPSIPPPSWLSVTPRQINSPGRVTASVTRPSAGPGSYFGRVVFRQRAGATVTELNAVLVRLELKEPGDAFAVSPHVLSYQGQSGNPMDAQSLFLTGASCSSVKVEPSDPWIVVTPESTLPACRRLNVAISSRNPVVGGQSGLIKLTQSGKTIEVPVATFLASRGPLLATNPDGLQFEARAGNGSAVTRNLVVQNPGDGTLAWTARVIDPPEGAPWLSLGGFSGTAAQGSDGRIPVSVNPGTLAVGQYSALIEVAAAGARNSPQLCPVSFAVLDASTPAVATPSPSGMIFTVEENSGRSTAQNMTVFTSNTQLTLFQTTVHTFDASGWLNAGAEDNNASTSVPGRVAVTVNPSGLSPGVYRGEVNAFVPARGSAVVRSVNVTMIVTPAPPAPPPKQPPRAANCSSNSLVPTHTGLYNNFQTRTGWPTPLNIRLFDNCGDPVTTAQVMLEFSNGDPPLQMTNLNNGNYIGTWAPRAVAPDSVSIRGTVTLGQLSARIELLGQVLPGANPVIEPNGVWNRFDRRTGISLSPGALIELTGANLAAGAAAVNPDGGSLPDSANGVTVFAGAARSPLSALSPKQLSAQLPVGLDTGQILPVVVKAGNTLSVPARVGLMPSQPGVASISDENGAAIGAENKARRGSAIFLVVAGMGETSPPVAAGTVSPADPLAVVTALPAVTVGGVEAEVRNAALVPGLIGLYQVEIVLGGETPGGDQPLVLRQGGAASNTVTIPVEELI